MHLGRCPAGPATEGNEPDKRAGRDPHGIELKAAVQPRDQPPTQETLGAFVKLSQRNVLRSQTRSAPLMGRENERKMRSGGARECARPAGSSVCAEDSALLLGGTQTPRLP